MDQVPSPSRAASKSVASSLLIVEDDFLTRWGAAEYLRHAGYRVSEAINVAEAIAIVSSGTKIDVVFSDVKMLGKHDGHFLSRWLATHYPAIPVLLTSSIADEGDALPHSLSRRFIAKPYDLPEVERLLMSMLKQDHSR